MDTTITTPSKNIIINNLLTFFKMLATDYQQDEGAHLIFSDINFPVNNVCIVPEACTLTPNAIDKLLSLYGALPISSFCVFKEGEDQSSVMQDYLLANRFIKTDSYSGLTKALTSEQYTLEIPADVRIDILASEAQFDDWIIPIKAGFGYSDIAASTLLKHLKKNISNENLKHFIIYQNNKPAGCASILITGKNAGLYNLAVIPEYRNQGLGLLLQKTRLNLAVERQCETAIMQAAVVSEYMAKKLGFKKISLFTPYFYNFS